MTLYEDLKAAGIPTDNHESDLYCLATPEAVELCKAWGVNFSYFTSQTDGKRWIESFGQYDPFWASRACKRFATDHGIPLEDVTIAVCIAYYAAECAEHEANGDTFPEGKDEPDSSKKAANARQWDAEGKTAWDRLADIFGPHGFEVTSTGLRPCLKKDGNYYDIPS